MRYRSRAGIAAAILESAQSEATITRIMYKTFISYTQMKEYLEFLTDNGLLKQVKGGKAYSITKKGERFMRTFKEMEEMLLSNSKS